MASSMGTVEVITTGLTKRELFAAMAMQGQLANPDPQTVQSGLNSIAVYAVCAADRLIAELAKEPT